MHETVTAVLLRVLQSDARSLQRSGQAVIGQGTVDVILEGIGNPTRDHSSDLIKPRFRPIVVKTKSNTTRHYGVTRVEISA